MAQHNSCASWSQQRSSSTLAQVLAAASPGVSMRFITYDLPLLPSITRLMGTLFREISRAWRQGRAEGCWVTARHMLIAQQGCPQERLVCRRGLKG